MFISLRMVKFLHPIFQEFKWLKLCFVQKFENSNRIFGRFLGRWLFWGNYFKLSECRWHVLRIWWKTIKKTRSTKEFLIIYMFIIGFEKQPSKLSSWDTIYLSIVTKHFPPRRTEGCENDVCLYHKERIKRFQMDSVNYGQLISPFYLKNFISIGWEKLPCLFRYPSWHFLWY